MNESLLSRCVKGKAEVGKNYCSTRFSVDTLLFFWDETASWWESTAVLVWFCYLE